MLAITSMALACSVPVFRYALEHWRPDHYAAIVFHRGDLTPDEQAVIESMQSKARDGFPAANLFVKTVNLNNSELDPVLDSLWEQHSSESLPWMVLQSPPKWGAPETIWTGQLTAQNSALILDSPLRNQLKKKLLNGDSVVWVYLECGRKAEDDEAFATLEKELARLQQIIKPPEIAEVDLADLSIPPDSLKIAFSALRLSRHDPKEKAFIEILLRVEPDLRDEPYIDQPMAFPVFGRGRALYALTGDAIAADLIEEGCQFLVGACQCTVKAQNPGVDLLIHEDWNHSISPTEYANEPLPPLTGFEEFGQTASDEEPTSPSPLPSDDPDTVSHLPSESSVSTTNSDLAEDSPSATANSDHHGSDSTTPSTLVDRMSKNLMLALGVLLGIVLLATLVMNPRKS